MHLSIMMNLLKTRHQNHMGPTFLMTNGDMQPFPTAIGGVYPSFSYLDPPMGTGVV